MMDKEPIDQYHEVGAVKQEESPRKSHPGGGGGADRLKRDEWSEGAVSSLLEAYESKWVLRNRAKLKGQDWEDVARFVSSRANSTKAPKTQTQCKNKIESMKKRYRSESSAADASSSSWPLYHRLDHLLRGNSAAGAAASSTTAAAPPPPVMLPSRQQHQHCHPPPLLLLEPSLVVQTLLPPAAEVLIPQPAPPPPPPSLMIPSLLIAPPALPNRNSPGSTGVDRVGGKDEHGVQGGSKFSADHVSDRNTNINAAATADTDSSTPALVYSDQKETNNNKNGTSKRVKMKRKSAGAPAGGGGARRRSSSEWEIAESIRWLAEVVVRSEQTRMETMRELEKMRLEAEAKRGQMDLKRTEIVANTQLEIAKLFAGLSKGTGPVDSSLRIGRN